MTKPAISKELLNSLMPKERSDEFFDALYGDAEEGAYDIKLVLKKQDEKSVTLAFELRQRPDKCLVCSLTYGLPQVFKRHPLINTAGIVKEVATALGWDPESCTFDLGPTKERHEELHCIELIIQK